MEWKHTTKINVIRQIKERNLFHSIPETNTIQSVLNVIYPLIFTTKNEAKFFLTVIGDNILKKNYKNIYLVSQKMKQFLNELDDVAATSIGCTNIMHCFVMKYHESHSYENYRLIKINENVSKQMWRELLKQFGLDLLCVAAHYSKRYESAEKFIYSNPNEDFKIYTYYLKNHTLSQIVGEFCEKYLVVSTEPCKIEWRNLHFVWKQFLSDEKLQNFTYSTSLKALLREKYVYQESCDSFIGITSKYLPTHSDFIKFWEASICIETNNSNDKTGFTHTIEMDELCLLFKIWYKNTSGAIHEENIVKILKHFFPDVKIVDDKYVLDVTCKLWDKINDIHSSFVYIKEQFLKNDSMRELITLDEAYNYYYKYCNMNSFKFVVSKSYFEKYICYKLSPYIEYEKFVKTSYFLQSEEEEV
jgi:hypothetical protein